MEKYSLISSIAMLALAGAAKADPVDLSAYADANGYIDVQALTCGQLANTFQEDANALTTWYSGWYNGLAHKHYADFKKGKIAEHQVIEYCKAHPDREDHSRHRRDPQGGPRRRADDGKVSGEA